MTPLTWLHDRTPNLLSCLLNISLTARKCCWSASWWRPAVQGTFHKSDAEWSSESPSPLGPHCQTAPAAERTDRKHTPSQLSVHLKGVFRWINNTMLSFITSSYCGANCHEEILVHWTYTVIILEWIWRTCIQFTFV